MSTVPHRRITPCSTSRRLVGGTGLFVWITIVLTFAGPALRAADYAIGADLSFLKQAEGRGVVYRDGTRIRPGLEIFKDHGYNWIRLRLFHAPKQLPNGLDYTIALAQQARAQGFKFLLDLHYSDTWADPKQQTTPAAWTNQTHAQLQKTVCEYTRDTIRAFRAAGVLPDLVQVGNEITHGLLWPDGKLPEHWENFADLLKAGIDGVQAGCGTNARPRIMIHIDRGGDPGGTKYFFDHLNAYGVPYDVIGQWYYPWWQGSLDSLRTNLNFMATNYQKDIVIVETAYCWRPTEYTKAPGPFPETPQGQREFYQAVNRLVRNTPTHRGIGLFWWEPAVGHGRLRDRGFFEDDGNALPIMNALGHPDEK